MEQIDNWRNTAQNITTSLNNENQTIKSYFSVIGHIHKHDWLGACHATSAILHIMLSEKGESSSLYIGECKNGNIIFDHSWVEIDGHVFDAAISNTLIQNVSFPPVYWGNDLNNGKRTNTEYGISSGEGYDTQAAEIKNTSFGQYMDAFPNHKDGLWGVAKEIASLAGLNLNMRRLKEKYSLTEWNEKT